MSQNCVNFNKILEEQITEKEKELSHASITYSESNSSYVTQNFHNGLCNPHGIDTILNKRDFATHQESMAESNAKTISEHSRSSANLYWPGIQGLLTNPTFWRDRGTHMTGEIFKY